MTDTSDSAKRVAIEMATADFPNVHLYHEFSGAFLGFGTKGSGSEPVACYDYEKCLSVLSEDNGWDREESEEFLQYNYINAWVGDGTPFFLTAFTSSCTSSASCT